MVPNKWLFHLFKLGYALPRAAIEVARLALLSLEAGRGSVMNFAKTSALFILGIAILTGAASALTTKHLATDAEMLALISDTLFVAEGRIGDLGGAATFELDLGPDTGHPAQQANYGWVSSRLEPFTLTYDNATRIVTFTLGGHTLTYMTPYMQFGDMFVRTRAYNDATSVVVNDLVLNGQSVGDQSSAALPGTGIDILWISEHAIANGFTLTGVAMLSWTGSPPTQSRLAFQIKVAKLAQVGVEGKTWGGIKALFE